MGNNNQTPPHPITKLLNSLWQLNLMPRKFSTKSKIWELGININCDCPFCQQIEEEIDYLFKTCDLAKPIWSTIDTKCPSNNSKFPCWIGSNKFGAKKVVQQSIHNLLEKIVTIDWAIQNHRNNEIVRNHTCNHVCSWFGYENMVTTLLYSKTTNNLLQDDGTSQRPRERKNKQTNYSCFLL